MDEYGVRFVSLKVLAETADVISVNVPNTPMTNGLINAELIESMKDNATVISISREQGHKLPLVPRKAHHRHDGVRVLAPVDRLRRPDDAHLIVSHPDDVPV